jgi:hypothetical protein
MNKENVAYVHSGILFTHTQKKQCYLAFPSMKAQDIMLGEITRHRKANAPCSHFAHGTDIIDLIEGERRIVIVRG